MGGVWPFPRMSIATPHGRCGGCGGGGARWCTAEPGGRGVRRLWWWLRPRRRRWCRVRWGRCRPGCCPLRSAACWCRLPSRLPRAPRALQRLRCSVAAVARPASAVVVAAVGLAAAETVATAAGGEREVVAAPVAAAEGSRGTGTGSGNGAPPRTRRVPTRRTAHTTRRVV